MGALASQHGGIDAPSCGLFARIEIAISLGPEP
jgi:hypothetical protein